MELENSKVFFNNRDEWNIKTPINRSEILFVISPSVIIFILISSAQFLT